MPRQRVLAGDAVKVEIAQLHRAAEEMHVAVDEAWQHGGPPASTTRVPGAGEAADVRCRAHGGDGAVLDRQCLGARAVGIEGDETAVQDDGFGRAAMIGHSVGRGIREGTGAARAEGPPPAGAYFSTSVQIAL